MLNRIRLKYLINALASKKRLPPIIRVNQQGKLYTVTVCEQDSPDNFFANATAGSGTSNSVILATLKALSEHVERLAFYQHHQKLLIPNSTGFAAYPKIFRFKKNVKKAARYHAYYEAYERYSWPSWWQDHSIGTEIVALKTKPKYWKYAQQLLEGRIQLNEYKDVLLLFPQVEPNHFLVIACILLNPIGIIAGGSAEKFKFRHKAIQHALEEMARHVFAYRRAKKLSISPKSIYEKKLFYFAEGKGDELFQNRIKAKGNERIFAPGLEIDEEISHDLVQYFYVHRCKLRGQFEFTEPEDQLVY